MGLEKQESRKPKWKHTPISVSPKSKPCIFLLCISFSLFFSPVSMSPSVWSEGCFSEVNHSRFQAPHQSRWSSMPYRAVGVNMEALKADFFFKNGTWTWDLLCGNIKTCLQIRPLLFEFIVYNGHIVDSLQLVCILQSWWWTNISLYYYLISLKCGFDYFQSFKVRAEL